MRVRVDACLHIGCGELSERLFERLRRALSFPNPAYLDRLRLGRHPGGEPELLCLVEEEEEEREVLLPRGAIHVLRQAAAAEDLAVECDDRRVLPPEPLVALPSPPLRNYQEAAVDRLARVTQGVVVLPCGGGKTRVGIGAIARLRTPALVLVHTLDLAEQWRGQLHALLGVEAGLIGDGETRPGLISVALVQALTRWERLLLDAFLARFGLLIVDEAHHCPSATFRAVVNRCPARYRLGLTATPEREDGLTPLLELYLGAPLAIVAHEALVAAGVLTLPEIRNVETHFDYPYCGAESYAPMLAALAADPARNALIVDSIAGEARAGHICLALSGRVDHCEELVWRLREVGVTTALLTGQVPKERRKDLLDKAREGRLSALVATSLADEGLDLPRLSRVFLTYPSRARGRTLQRLGRLMRPHPDKATAVLFDFVDRRVPILRRHHVERRRLYAEVLGVPASRLGALGSTTTAPAR